MFGTACDKSASGTWYAVMLIEAWQSTLNFVLCNSWFWVNSFASRRSHGVERQGVAELCDTQSVQMYCSACCFSCYSTKQFNCSCYQWLRHVIIIDTINGGDDSNLLYKCLTPVLEVVSPLERLQFSFATPCTMCVRVRTFFLSLLFTKQNIKNTSRQVSSQYTSMQIYLAALNVAAPVITSNPMQKQMKEYIHIY